MTDPPVTAPAAAGTDVYTSTLTEYLRARSESALYHASLLGQQFVEQGLGPDDIVALHGEALDQAMRGIPPRLTAVVAVDGLQFLLEVMIAFGVHHRHYLELRLAERSQQAELALARERQRAEDAARADQDKATLLATISHELRTPITAVRGSLQMIDRFVARGQVELLGQVVSQALVGVDRLVRLGDALVAASRGEAQELALTVRDLVPTLRQACAWIEAAATSKGLALSCAGPPGPLLVAADADALLSVFSNLLANASRYTPAGGQVALTWGHSDETASAWVEVRDTGIGMSPATQAHIFERFYRAPEAPAVEASGLGLGLALVHQLVQAHGGTVTVTSAVGAGSTFRVLLPLADAEREESTDDRGRAT